VHVEKAVAFAEREGFRALELDLYGPSEPGVSPDGPRPLLVYVHGGGWRVSHRSRPPRETREWSRGVFERLTDMGFVVAAPDYRLSGEALFPAQLDDTLEALRWLHANAGDLGVVPGRTYLWGASAGGNLAALAALVANAPPVAGVVCWYPITDLPALDHDATDTYEAHLLGGPIGEHIELARSASPVTHVHGGAPPFLLQHGEDDTWVPHEQSVHLANALRAAGVSVELETVPGADHFFAGATDAEVEAIFQRALDFLVQLDTDAKAGAATCGVPTGSTDNPETELRTDESVNEKPARRISWSDVFVHPDENPRTAGGVQGERATLTGYLRDQRLTLELKCSGLDAAALARRSVEPSNLSLLGLVRHMAGVEQAWFRLRMAGQDVPRHFRSDADPDGDFNGAVPDPGVVAEAWDAWRAEVAFAEQYVAEAPGLEVVGKRGDVLREVLVHMIEEYARHNGHADLLRVRIDGRVGQ
jgi:acetyl esterase/lipase